MAVSDYVASAAVAASIVNLIGTYTIGHRYERNKWLREQIRPLMASFLMAAAKHRDAIRTTYDQTTQYVLIGGNTDQEPVDLSTDELTLLRYEIEIMAGEDLTTRSINLLLILGTMRIALGTARVHEDGFAWLYEKWKKYDSDVSLAMQEVIDAARAEITGRGRIWRFFKHG